MQIFDIDKAESVIKAFNALVCLKENTASIDKKGICQTVDKIGSSHHAPGLAFIVIRIKNIGSP